MWMVMDSSTANDLKLPADPVISRKLRPLMPRPSTTPYSNPPSCCCIRNPNILSWNHSISDHAGVKRETQTAAPLVSTRWNPTPEQLQALEEMYRRGIRTPSAEQIQQIAAKLGRFGKIEGKNVFYWFQNHKARERQKKRRQLELLAAKNMQHHTNHQTGLRLSRRSLEIEIDKKEPIPSNCSTPSPSPSEDSASMHGAVIAAAEISGKDHKELQHNVATATAENETCWPLHLHLHLSSPSPSINQPTGQENNIASTRNQLKHKHDHYVVEDRTLDLFPTPRARREEDAPRSSTIETKITPSRFIEFLPIKESKEGSVYLI